MNKPISAFLTLVIALTLCGCSGAAANRTEQDTNVISIDISEETAAYRDEMVFSVSPDPRTSSEELQQASFDAAVKTLADYVQTFPEVETKNQLDSYRFEGSDVYTLCSGDDYDSVVLYVHGGAWIYGIDSLHVEFCDELADELGAKVCMPLYPLAPQATAEEDYEMLLGLYSELLKENKPIYVMGDSAGGTIALGLVLQLRDAGVKLPEKVVVLAPCADASFSNSEIQELQKLDGYLSWAFCRSCAKLWAGDEDISDPSISPINGDYSGFPDTLMYIGTYDILSADDRILFDRMGEAGVNAELVEGNGFWHVYPVSDIKEQPQLVQILTDFCLE